ncbi:hypothetical protein EC844_11930 [Acinetobacter calcoaceticus]|uniref:Uncharacterized protein n=1 Tax=Acinetobacter calcoaceticus TaxID=471 RepID=A0A4R1XK71_ACICA|nr:hypothetical protein EC844_11930 [Acinetobacter calcoaceticus]
MELPLTSIETWKVLGFDWVKLIGVLDGRSCLICACLDGTVVKVAEANRLAKTHNDCRCCLVGCDEDGDIPGLRPFVMHHKPVKNIPKDQRDGRIGQVDANTMFVNWFDKCHPEFQLEYLDEFRFNLYKNHGYKLTDFVDMENLRILENHEIKKAP